MFVCKRKRRLIHWSHGHITLVPALPPCLPACPSPCLFDTYKYVRFLRVLSINQLLNSHRSTSLLVKRPHGVGIAIALLWPFHPHRALITIISGRWRTALSRGLRRQQHHVGDGPVRFVVRPPQRAGGCQEGREGGHLPVPRWSHLLFGPEGKWEGGGVRYPHTDPIGILCARRTR